MRIAYNLLAYAAQIPLLAYWLFRGLVNRRYRDRMKQRFGFGYPQLRSCIWIHAVSVGEVQASIPLVRALEKRFPQHRLLLTTVTPTGAMRVAAIFDDEVEHCYIPFEMPIAVDRFFAAVQPRLALIMETEIWPNLFRGCGLREIPLILVSARISPRSVGSYRRFLPLFRETLSHGIIIAAQSHLDAERFRSLGASAARTRVTGNIKFDFETAPDLPTRGRRLRDETFGRRRVWIAASTHDQEELVVLDAHRVLLESIPELLLVVVPRHPERFAAVADLIQKRNFNCVTRTSGERCTVATEVFLGNTMGELPMLYAASDVAFVGGSLVPVGGHNLLEPAAVGVPVISGPYVFNAQEIADMFIGHDACRIVKDSVELAAAVRELLDDPDLAAARGEQARKIVQDNRGALDRLLALLDPLIDNVGQAQ